MQNSDDFSHLDTSKTSSLSEGKQNSSSNTYFASLMDWINWGTSNDPVIPDDSPLSEEGNMDGEDEDILACSGTTYEYDHAIEYSGKKQKLMVILPSVFAALLILSIIGLYINRKRHAIKIMKSMPVDPEIITVTSVVTPYGRL